MKHELSTNSKDICEYIFNDYIDGMELDETEKIIKSIPLLIDNGLAVKISGNEYLEGSAVSIYRIASKFIQKYNRKLKRNRRILKECEFGSSGNVYAKNNPEIVKLSKYSLDVGTYFAELGKSEYCVFLVRFDEKDEYSIMYDLYFIGDKWKKWRDKFYKQVDYYKDLKKKEKSERIYFIGGKPSQSAIFKPFDKIIFKGKNDVLSYIDNFVNNIPKYYDYGMTPKLSIILYGNPGTGKSTFSKAVANYLDIDSVTSVPPESFSYSAEDDSRGRSRGGANAYAGMPTIYVLDDIDCVCKSREIDTNATNAKVLANLLSFLDNPPTFDYKAKNGVHYPISILVASTNYYDKLDDAVKRYGRFDLKIEMNDFNKEEAQQMCDIYNLKLEDLVKDSNKKDFTISPSYLQALCLENIDKSMKEI
jgi:hypothetical protein